MRKCPKCGKWTLEFDDYFGRYRCFNPGCDWIPASSAERTIKLLERHEQPKLVCQESVPKIGVQVQVKYDSVNDTLSFDFGMNQPTIDLPEPDGRIIWKISPFTDTVVGFEILEAKNFGVSQVRVDIAARKENIEINLNRIPGAFASGRPTRMLITGVALTIDQSAQSQDTCPAFLDAITKFESSYCHK